MTRTYVDSGILIAASRSVGDQGAFSLTLLADERREFVSSVFVPLEVLPKAVFHRQLDEIEFYQSFFARVVAWAEPIDRVIEESYRIATRHGLNALDALHVAAAVVLGAEELVTTEGPRKPIHRATGVRVVGL